jgi:hypothetical protein
LYKPDFYFQRGEYRYKLPTGGKLPSSTIQVEDFLKVQVASGGASGELRRKTLSASSQAGTGLDLELMDALGPVRFNTRGIERISMLIHDLDQKCVVGDILPML